MIPCGAHIIQLFIVAFRRVRTNQSFAGKPPVLYDQIIFKTLTSNYGRRRNRDIAAIILVFFPPQGNGVKISIAQTEAEDPLSCRRILYHSV